MGIGAAVVRADWLALDSMWVPPINLKKKKQFPDSGCHKKTKHKIEVILFTPSERQHL
jgi:hypothetical protein